MSAIEGRVDRFGRLEAGPIGGDGRARGGFGVRERKRRRRGRGRLQCRSRGLLVGKGGLYGNVIRMSPPLNIAKSDVDEAIRIMDEALSAVRQPAVAAAR